MSEGLFDWLVKALYVTVVLAVLWYIPPHPHGTPLGSAVVQALQCGAR